MSISDVSIHRPVLTLVIAISTIVFGLIGYFGMGIDLYPEIEFPVVTVSASLPGASPEVVEGTVTRVLEDQVATLAQIETISSISSFGNGVVIVEFALEKDIDVAVQEIRDRVGIATRFLPEDLDPPIVQKLNIADQPIMWASATSHGDYWELARWVDQVAQPRMQQLDGVGSVLLGAFRNRAYRVWLDPQALAARGMGPLDVAQEIVAEHVELPAGKAESAERDIPIRVFGEFSSAAALGGMLLRGGEQPVRLRDVARVEEGLQDAQSIARFNGVPTIGMGVRKQSGANTVEVAERVKAFLPELQKDAPPGVALNVAFDSSRFIRGSITGVQFDILFGVLLTALVMFLFLESARATAIIALALPTSLISTFALMNAAGFTMNNLTMLGLSLAVGMVVDDAIVVVECVYRHLEHGEDRLSAARDAMKEIGFAVIVATASIIAVFLPIAYMKGVIGRFFFQFGITVSFALAISLVIALTLTPMLASRFLDRADASRHLPERWFWPLLLVITALMGLFVYRALEGTSSALLVVAGLLLFGILRKPFESIFVFLERGYAKLLAWALAHRKTVLVAATVLFAAGAGLAASPLVAKTFSRPSDESRFLVRFQAPVGTALARTNELSRAVEKIVLAQPEMHGAFVATGFGGGGGAPQPNVGIAFVNLTRPGERRRTQDQVMDSLRRELNGIPGLMAFVDRISPVGGGQRNTDVQYVIQGPELDGLARYADEIVRRMRTAGGFKDVDSSLDLERPEARVLIDRERAKALGVPARDIVGAINMIMGGTDVAFVQEGGDRYPIRLKADPLHSQEPADLGRILIRSRDGTIVELANVVRIERAVGPNVINRYNRQRSATIFANLAGKGLGDALKEVETIIAETLPPGGLYTAQVAGSSKTFQDSFRYLLQALILAILVVYLVLAAQFDSFIHPLTIMATLPLALIGVSAGLALSGLSLDILSFIGIVMLVGIVTKNGILLVDYANLMRHQGATCAAAMQAAGPVRLRPVLMTAVTTMVGMIPVALSFSEGGESRASMGMAVFAGMLTATPLTLVVIPVVYTLFDGAVAWSARHAAGIRNLALAAIGGPVVVAMAVHTATLSSAVSVPAAGVAFGLILGIGLPRLLWRGWRGDRAEAARRRGE
ncbi:MAG: efflux RND transporter permease subunit [Candidatus Schekmanbacteria bacterium]|nr:efflux RND transporter permease subunit [Candidatus Schekmanbacteria bacterium]